MDIQYILQMIPNKQEPPLGFKDEDVKNMFLKFEGTEQDMAQAIALIKEHRPELYSELVSCQPPLYTPPTNE